MRERSGTTLSRAGTLAVALLSLIMLMAPARADAVGLVHEHRGELEGFDTREPAAGPGSAPRAAARRLGAKATFNRFGTVGALTKTRGWLATGLSGDAEAQARAFLRSNAGLFGLSASGVDALDLVNDVPLGSSGAHVLLLRQSFGDLPVVGGGLVSVGVVDGKVAHASSSLGRGRTLTGEQRLVAQDAWRKAAASVGRGASADRIRSLGRRGTYGILGVPALGSEQQVRLAALPMPGGGARRVYEANVVDLGPDPLAFSVYVDAETGRVLRRVNRLESAGDQPNWKYFRNIPPLDGTGTDSRIFGCFPGAATPQPPCTLDERMGDFDQPGATPFPWDVVNGSPATQTTTGNNADTGLSGVSPLTPGLDRVRPVSSTREYIYPFANQWQASKCNPQEFAAFPTPNEDVGLGSNENDLNAAIVSLFSNHNNMHDWAYSLGFTEETFNMQQSNFDKTPPESGLDPELGNAQAGRVAGGAPTYTGRDNANQITFGDGVAPITNMYLWQPIASAFYPPCVDGDFDMSVIGHEYTHAISNRMVAGPEDGLTSSADGQARAMGESFSDLTAVEFLQEHGYSPVDGENEFAVGAYVTGSKEKGIRNYGMDASPLNYSGVQGYDGSGMGSPHDDGEIWSATNFDIREALLEKYPAGDQLACARGQVPVGQCPGNRRWMQLVFDSYLLMPMDGAVSMLEARDALLEADQMRFAGANQTELWDAFARRGFGENASSDNPAGAGSDGDTDDPDPIPSFESPLRSDESTVTFKPSAPEGGGAPVAELFVGEYESNVTPVADTDPATELDDKVELLPGEYSFVSRADGFGAQKFTEDISGASDLDLNVAMPTNRASASNGATATGDDEDSVNEDLLIDDTEETNWAVLNRQPDVAGADVTVKLAGGRQRVERVNVSALLRATDDGDEQGDTGSQNRFTALREFKLYACDGTDQECDEQSEFDSTLIFESSPDAFPGDVPRPLAPDMILRGFDVDDTTATHVRIEVVTNQCLGNPTFIDNTLDTDPSSNSDCRLGNVAVPDSDDSVRAAELQVFSRAVEASVTASPQPTTGGSGTPGTGNVLPNNSQDQICAEIAAFRSVSVLPRGRGARIAFSRRRNTPVNVDVFQQSRGERITRNRRVASFRGRRRSFTWRGRGFGGRRLPSGRYAVRFRVPSAVGRLDIRHVALVRQRARFRRRPAFSATGSCGLLNVYRLSGSTFSGRRRPLAALFRVRRRSTVSVVVRRRGRVVRRLRARSFAAGRPFRLNIRSSGLRRGDYRVTVTARSGSERVTRTLVSRRL